MKFEKAAGRNAIDRGLQVGRATARVDGPLKVSGRATYAAERWRDLTGLAQGYIIGAAIAKGRMRSIDTRDAEAAAGVIAVITAANAGTLGKAQRNTARLLGGPDIQHYHQAIALVVAETSEQARAAAKLVRIDYERAPGKYGDLSTDKGEPAAIVGGPADTAVGNFETAYAAAPVTIDSTYRTAANTHAMMEPFASVARWDGDAVSVWTSTQMVDWARSDLATTLGCAKDKVTIISPYVGGGFGGKLFLRADALLAALGARQIGRPVRVVMPRPLMTNNATHRPSTLQRLRIGADRDGRILAVGHEGWSADLAGGKAEGVVRPTRTTYAGRNRMTRMRLSVTDLPEGNAMRAPGEAPGSNALEIAMDELAEALRMDPVELRIRNDTQVNPEHPDRPFSQRNLIRCLQVGAKQFGWARRNRTPGGMRRGDWLIGHGVAGAMRDSPAVTSGARVRLVPGGRLVVETDMTDIGTGSYTIIAQTAAEMLGLPLDAVDVRLGDSSYPVSAGSGGQFGANSATSGVYAACVALRDKLARRAGFDPASSTFEQGELRQGAKRIPLAEIATAGGIEAEDTIAWDGIRKSHHFSAFGAHFVEVGVDVYTAEVRIRRMLAVCAAGRILNPLTARSQVIGAMTMGAGAALSEELDVDRRFGFFVNHDLASYEVPVHADIPRQDVIFLSEPDPLSSPMKANGVGELGICGVGGAVANAVFNATGIRVRNFPIAIETLLERMPAV